MESIVFFFVLLFLSLLALAIRWLNAKIRREIAFNDLKDLFGPSEDSRKQPEGEPRQRTEIDRSQKPPVMTSRAVSSPQGRRLRIHPRLGNRADLRHGIIVMTILGPCRSLEPQREDYSIPVAMEQRSR